MQMYQVIWLIILISDIRYISLLTNMESLSKRLVDEIKGFTAGSGDAKTLDKAIASAHELLEKLYILRYNLFRGAYYDTPPEGLKRSKTERI